MHHAQDRNCIAVVSVQDDVVPDRKLPYTGNTFSPNLRKRLNPPDCPFQHREIGIALRSSPLLHGVSKNVPNVRFRVGSNDKPST